MKRFLLIFPCALVYVVLAMFFWRANWNVKLFFRLHGISVEPCFYGRPSLHVLNGTKKTDLSPVKRYPELVGLSAPGCVLDVKVLEGFGRLQELSVMPGGELLNVELLTNHLDILTVDCSVAQPIRDARLREKFFNGIWSAQLLLRPGNVEAVLACPDTDRYHGIWSDDVSLSFLTHQQVEALRNKKFSSINGRRPDCYWEEYDRKWAGRIDR